VRARFTAATGGDGRRRDSAAFSRSAAYSPGDTRTPIVVERNAAGSPLGRPPFALRGVAS
jgi:hypothetical protein